MSFFSAKAQNKKEYNMRSEMCKFAKDEL